MASRFSERLDFLMSLTNTTNSALARELSFDASYISRIRNGKRGVPLHQPFIEPAATYLASRVREPYQVQTVEQALHMPGRWPASADRGAQLVARWLVDDDATLDAQFDKLLKTLTALPNRITPAPEPKPAPPAAEAREAAGAARFFVGNQGKRDATELFLAELAETGAPQSLLVYSDENMDWLAEDRAFARRWMTLLSALIAQGSTVTVVHTITRDIGEMLDAIQKWLPLYLTGRIQSYYCPRIRDGICRRTLFVARGSAALSASSIESCSEGMPNVLVSGHDAVKPFELEFEHLLSLCKPLVSVAPLSAGCASEAQGASFAALNPNARSRIGELGAPVVETPRLPHDMVAFVNENEGFTIAHVGEPRMAMRVTERLLTAAFAEYLR